MLKPVETPQVAVLRQGCGHARCGVTVGCANCAEARGDSGAPSSVAVVLQRQIPAVLCAGGSSDSVHRQPRRVRLSEDFAPEMQHFSASVHPDVEAQVAGTPRV